MISAPISRRGSGLGWILRREVTGDTFQVNFDTSSGYQANNCIHRAGSGEACQSGFIQEEEATRLEQTGTASEYSTRLAPV